MYILQLGFRPFYSIASIFAIVAVLAWLSVFTGFLSTGDYLQGVVWHSHEMLFGFSAAVIAGFLFTAVRNWTGLPTPTGAALAAITALWLLARILIISGPATLAAIIDGLFLPAVAVAIAFPIIRSKNVRNYKVPVIILALAVSNGVFHLASLGYVQFSLSRISLLVSIDIIVVLMALVGGRVIPAFTKNAVPEATSRHNIWVECVTFAAMIAAILSVALSGAWKPPALSMAALFGIVAIAHVTRLALWDPVKTIGNPLLWMMPAAYSWIPFAFVLRALAAVNIVPSSTWIHAITMGAISGLMLAMMMRSSLGHTGRKLVASRLDMTAFLLLQLAAIVRVVASIGAAGSYHFWIVISGVLWALAFLLFVVRYLPMLSTPRVPDAS